MKTNMGWCRCKGCYKCPICKIKDPVRTDHCCETNGWMKVVLVWIFFSGAGDVDCLISDWSSSCSRCLGVRSKVFVTFRWYF